MPTLTVDFVTASPAPALGYRLRYRPVGQIAYTTLPSQLLPPILVYNLALDTAYEGDVQALCATGQVSTRTPFTVAAVLNTAPLVTVAMGQPRTGGSPSTFCPGTYVTKIATITCSIATPVSYDIQVSVCVLYTRSSDNLVSYGTTLVTIDAGQTVGGVDERVDLLAYWPDTATCAPTVATLTGGGCDTIVSGVARL